jgi:hypothetical protein
MKRLLKFQALLVFLFTLLISVGVKGQDTTFRTLPSITITPSTQVSKEVTRAFLKSFPDAKKPLWYQLNKNYLVKFITKDQTNRALYRNNGQLIYHIQYGHVQNLPEDIRKLVKANYVEYNITSVIYVNQDDRKIWLINVENKSKLIVVRYEDGELQQVDNYNKA